MMLTKESLSSKLYVRNMMNKFEEVAESREKQRMDPRVFTMLNYEKIIDEMCQYVQGYVDYKAKGSDKYKGEVMGNTIQFYNRMFTDEKKYRRKMYLADMKDICKGFLEQTKRLQTLMEKYVDESAIDHEMKTLLELTDNQYKKVSKVNKDDIEIYFWLLYDGTYKNHDHKYDLPTSLRVAFNTPSTPVMHLYENRKGDME